MHSAHVASEGLASCEIFVAGLTVELDCCDAGLIDAGLFGRLGFADDFAALLHCHFSREFPLLNVTQALH